MTVLSLKNTITQYFNQGIDTAVKHGHRLRETASNAVQKAVNKIPEEKRLLVRNATIGTFVLLSTSFAANNLYGAFSPRKFDAIPVPTPSTPTPSTPTPTPTTAHTPTPTTAHTPTTPPVSTNQQSPFADGSHPINYSNFIPWALGIAVTVVGLYFTCKRKPVKSNQQQNLNRVPKNNVENSSVKSKKRSEKINIRTLIQDARTNLGPQSTPETQSQCIERIYKALTQFESSEPGFTYLHDTNRLIEALPLLLILVEHDEGADKVCDLLSPQTNSSRNTPLHNAIRSIRESPELHVLFERLALKKPQKLLNLFALTNKEKLTFFMNSGETFKFFRPHLLSILRIENFEPHLLAFFKTEHVMFEPILSQKDTFFAASPIILSLLQRENREVQKQTAKLFVKAFDRLMNRNAHEEMPTNIVKRHFELSNTDQEAFEAFQKVVPLILSKIAIDSNDRYTLESTMKKFKKLTELCDIEKLIEEAKDKLRRHSFPRIENQFIEKVYTFLSQIVDDPSEPLAKQTTFLHLRFKDSLPLLLVLAEHNAGADRVCDLLSLQTSIFRETPLHEALSLDRDIPQSLHELLNKLEDRCPDKLIQVFKLKNSQNISFLTCSLTCFPFFRPHLLSLSEKYASSVLDIIKNDDGMASISFIFATPILLRLLQSGSPEVKEETAKLFVQIFDNFVTISKEKTEQKNQNLDEGLKEFNSFISKEDNEAFMALKNIIKHILSDKSVNGSVKGKLEKILAQCEALKELISENAPVPVPVQALPSSPVTPAVNPNMALPPPTAPAASPKKPQ